MLVNMFVTLPTAIELLSLRAKTSGRASVLVMKVNEPFHVHDSRNASSALALQWQSIIKVIYHAAMLLCYPDNWEEVMRGIPRICYSTGEAFDFYAVMTIATSGSVMVDLAQQLIDKMLNMHALYICHMNEFPTRFFTQRMYLPT